MCLFNFDISTEQRWDIFIMLWKNVTRQSFYVALHFISFCGIQVPLCFENKQVLREDIILEVVL